MHCTRGGRRAVERAQPRDAAVRTGHDRRRRRKHGDRGPHAGRRNWLADVEVRPRTRHNLRSADLVMADGRVIRASVDENPDLFWAIRGGGGNFGIAASLEYTLHPCRPDDHRRCCGPSRAASGRRAPLLPRYVLFRCLTRPRCSPRCRPRQMESTRVAGLCRQPLWPARTGRGRVPGA